MKRKFLSFFIPCLLLVSAAGEAQAAAWKNFSSSIGNFNVLMPGTPVLKQSTEKSFVGSIGVNLYDLKAKNGQYSVEYSDLPGIAVDLGGSKTIMDKAKKGFLKDNGGTEQAFTDISLGEFPGKELTYTDGGVSGTVHFYLVERRLYVVAGSYGPAGNSANVAKFLGSFQLINSSPPKKQN